MARIRSLKPTFFTSEDVAALSLPARLTWIGLWTYADDHGRGKDNARLVKAAVWSLDDERSIDDVEAYLTELAAAGRIVRWVVNGRPYFAVVNWHLHQAINRPKASTIPKPPRSTGADVVSAPGYCADCAHPVDNRVPAGQPQHGAVTDESVTHHGSITSGGEGKGREGRGRVHDASLQDPSLTNHGPGTAPPSKCPKHTNTAHPPACRACGDARRAHDDWTRSQTPKPTPTLTVPCPEHPDQPAGRCRPCEARAVPSPLKRRRGADVLNVIAQ